MDPPDDRREISIWDAQRSVHLLTESKRKKTRRSSSRYVKNYPGFSDNLAEEFVCWQLKDDASTTEPNQSLVTIDVSTVDESTLAGEDASGPQRNSAGRASTLTTWRSWFSTSFCTQYRFCAGTMSELHLRIASKVVPHPFPPDTIPLFFGVFRTMGMFTGLSNPILGLGMLLGAFCDSPALGFALLYTAVVSVFLCRFVFRIAQKEAVYNGLYPVGPLLSGLYLFAVRCSLALG